LIEVHCITRLSGLFLPLSVRPQHLVRQCYDPKMKKKLLPYVHNVILSVLGCCIVIYMIQEIKTGNSNTGI